MGGPAVREGEVVAGASGEWVLTKHIGSGSFAVVWLAEGASGERRGEVVAVKVICTDKLSSKLQQSLESEVSILKRISHRNIVALQEVIEVRPVSVGARKPFKGYPGSFGYRQWQLGFTTSSSHKPEAAVCQHCLCAK